MPPTILGIDLDLYKDAEAYARLEQLTGPLPLTVASSSKQDGSGIYLYRVPPLPQGKAWNSAPVDAVEVVQAGHRYCVVWPSIHPLTGQQYQWYDQIAQVFLDGPPDIDDDHIANLPFPAMTALLVDRNVYEQREPVELGLVEGEMSAKVVSKLLEGLEALDGRPGGRHDAMLPITAALLRLGANGEPGVPEALERLRLAFIDALTPDRPNVAHVAREWDDIISGGTQLVVSTESIVVELPVTVLGPATPLASGPMVPTPEELDEFFVDWPTLLNKDLNTAEWLIEPLLAKGRGHVLFAPAKVGKSLLSLWACLKLATGPDDVVVVYLDYEMGEDDLQERVDDMGFTADDDLSRLRYALLPSLPPLDTPEGGDALMAIVDAEQQRWPEHHIVVIIDTTGRAVVGEENSADTIRAFYTSTGIKLKRRGVTWARLDHAGKATGKGQRGSSAKNDDVDVVWQLEQMDNKDLRLTCTHSRPSWVPNIVTFCRSDEPLAYRLAEGDRPGYPPGTAEAVDTLKGLGVVVGTSDRKVGELLAGAGVTMTRKLRRAAVKAINAGIMRDELHVMGPAERQDVVV